MRYYSFLICLVAVSFSLTPRRRSDQSPPGQGTPLLGTDDVRMNQVQGKRERLIEDIRACRQLLNGFNTLSGEARNDTALLTSVKSCKRVVTVLDDAVDRSLYRHVQSRDQRFSEASQYLEETGTRRTTTSAFAEDNLARNTITAAETVFDSATHHSERKYRRGEICEDKVCETESLDEICNAEKIEPSVAQTCKMCYPARNAQLINAHCQEKWRRERKAFYVISFVLIAVTLASGLILYLRRRYLRAKNPHADELHEFGINPPGELYYYDGPRSILPAERGSSLAVNCSPEPQHCEHSNRNRNSWDEEEGYGMISTSFAQRRLRELGVLSRTGRKKIHDLFDLEAIQSRRGTVKGPERQPDDKDKVPVMPWAPNATVRSSSRSFSSVRSTNLSTSPQTIKLRAVP